MTEKMSAASKKKSVRKPALRSLSQEMARLRSRVKELEDLRDLNAAVVRNQGKPGVAWDKAKAALGLD
jgi:hypothetical protein